MVRIPIMQPLLSHFGMKLYQNTMLKKLQLINVAFAFSIGIKKEDFQNLDKVLNDY